MSINSNEIHEVMIGETPASLPGIIAVARRGVPVRISEDAAFRERMERSRRLLYAAVEADVPVYGVTTGYGKSCGNRLNKTTVLNGGGNLMRFHGCGTGEPLGIEETRAAMLCRLLCLARGYSGVSLPLLEHLAAFLNLGITPSFPPKAPSALPAISLPCPMSWPPWPVNGRCITGGSVCRLCRHCERQN